MTFIFSILSILLVVAWAAFALMLILVILNPKSGYDRVEAILALLCVGIITYAVFLILA